MTDKLETELEVLRARVAELEARANPPAPPKFEAGASGPTTTDLAMSRISMSPEVMAEMVRAVGSETIRGIVKSGGVGFCKAQELRRVQGQSHAAQAGQTKCLSARNTAYP